MRYRVEGGRLWFWDDEPPELFGQAWIPICVGCKRGPLNDGETVCGECPAELAPPEPAGPVPYDGVQNYCAPCDTYHSAPLHVAAD